MKLYPHFRLAFIFLAIVAFNSCKKSIDVTVPTPLATNLIADDPDATFQDYLATTPNLRLTLDSLVLSNGATIQQFLADNPEFKPEYDKVLRGARLSGSMNSISLVKKNLFAQVLLYVSAARMANITTTNLWDNDAQTLATDPYKNKDYFIADGRRTFTPKQPYGLAYSYGQRNWRERMAPPAGTCKDAAIYGLDCSGFIINVFQQAGFRIANTNVAGMYSKAYWENVLKSNTLLDSLKVDFVKNASGATQYPASSWNTLGLLPGDIVFWQGRGADGRTKWNHVGIVLRTAGKKLGIFQANGLPSPNPNETRPMNNCPDITRGDCRSNYACEGRGVRIKDMDFIQKYSGGSTTISVIRLYALVGNAGNPRFNLRFTNEQNVDLDLHVRTPAGFEIFYARPLDATTRGQLDVDCLCRNCPNGPNENIFWPLDRGSPVGRYRFWINYFEACAGAGTNTASNYEIFVINDKKPEILFKATGTMTPAQRFTPPTWEYDSTTGRVTRIQ
ncbi:MAG: NlpC/P60 family protein [Runella sp.]